MARTGSPRSRSKSVTVRPTAPILPAAPVTRIGPFSAMRLPSLSPNRRRGTQQPPYRLPAVLLTPPLVGNRREAVLRQHRVGERQKGVHGVTRAKLIAER